MKNRQKGLWGLVLAVLLAWVGGEGGRREAATPPCLEVQTREFRGKIHFRRPGVWQWESAQRGVPWATARLYWSGPPGWDGATVRVVGRMSCRLPYRNPDSGTEFGEWRGPRWRLRGDVVERTEPGAGRFWRGIPGAPHLTQWARAVWLGRGEGLDPALWEGAREMGIIPVLVQSGQHVMVWTALWSAWLGGRFAWGRWLFLGGLLWVNPSLPVLRLAAVGLARALVRARGLASSPEQCVASVLALHLLAFPSDLNRPGLLLSYLGAWAVMRQASVPLVLLPVLAAYFGAVPLVTVGVLGLVGGVWNWGAIPLGFAAPALGPMGREGAEWVWQWWTGWHVGWEFPLLAVRRPGGVSVALAVGLLLWVTGPEFPKKPRRRCTAIRE